MTLGALVVLIGPSSINVAASVTGDGYVAPFISPQGDWLIGNATVCTGETIVVTGEIFINGSGSLTLLTSHLTMTETSQYDKDIHINAGFLKIGAGSILDTTNPDGAGAGKTMLEVKHANNAKVYVSNATVRSTFFYNMVMATAGQILYFDNSTLYASKIYASTVTMVNISYNTFRDQNDQYCILKDNYGAVIVGNHFVNITQTLSGAVANNGMVSINGLTGGFTTLVAKNIIESSSPTTIGFVINAPSAALNVRQNRIQNVSAYTSAFAAGAGILLIGNGQNSIVSNNTIELVITHKGAGCVNSYGILIYQASSNWEVSYNNIWTAVKHQHDTPIVAGIHSQSASGINIHHNHIGNATGNGDDGNCAAGIWFGGTIGTVPTTITGGKIENNTIDNVDDATNGIYVGGAAWGNKIEDTLVANNTIGIVKDLSIGIGLYVAVRDNIVKDNTINNVWRDASGISIAHNSSGHVVRDNHINVINSGTMLPGWYSGALRLVATGFPDTGSNCTLTNNTITIVNQDLDGYPELNMSYCRQGTKLVMNQAGDYKAWVQFSNLTIQGYDNLPMLMIDGANSYSQISTYWTRTLWMGNDTNWHHVTVERTNLRAVLTSGQITFNVSVYSPSEHTIAEWTSTNSTNMNVTFTMSGLAAGMYNVYLDGVRWQTLMASGGSISFTYSGPWSQHQFEIRETSIGPAISGIVDVIFIMLAVGIIVGVTGETAYSFRRKNVPDDEMTRRVLNMVLYIIIGLALLGTVYAVIN